MQPTPPFSFLASVRCQKSSIVYLKGGLQYALPKALENGVAAEGHDDEWDEEHATDNLPEGMPADVLKISTLPWDRNKSNLADAGVKMLGYALALCDPVSLSIENQSVLMIKGAREKIG